MVKTLLFNGVFSLIIGFVLAFFHFKQKENLLIQYSCEAGWRYSALEYKVLQKKQAKDVIKQAEYECKSWSISAFLKRRDL